MSALFVRILSKFSLELLRFHPASDGFDLPASSSSGGGSFSSSVSSSSTRAWPIRERLSPSNAGVDDLVKELQDAGARLAAEVKAATQK